MVQPDDPEPETGWTPPDNPVAYPQIIGRSGAGVDSPYRGGPGALEDLVGGSDRLRFIETTDFIAAQRIVLEPTARGRVREVEIGWSDWLIPERHAQLVELVADADSYDWAAEPAETPQPSVIITFGRAGDPDRFEMRICFETSSLSFTPERWVSFAPAREAFVQWAQNLYRRDGYIQGL